MPVVFLAVFWKQFTIALFPKAEEWLAQIHLASLVPKGELELKISRNSFNYFMLFYFNYLTSIRQ